AAAEHVAVAAPGAAPPYLSGDHERAEVAIRHLTRVLQPLAPGDIVNLWGRVGDKDSPTIEGCLADLNATGVGRLMPGSTGPALTAGELRDFVEIEARRRSIPATPSRIGQVVDARDMRPGELAVGVHESAAPVLNDAEAAASVRRYLNG